MTVFAFLFRRNRELLEQLVLYVDTARQVLDTYRDGLRHYLEHGLNGLERFVAACHVAESGCDRIRRQIERDLFEKSLLPDAREDLMTLLEVVDLVPNQAEDVLRQIGLQHILLPRSLQAAYADLGMCCHETGMTLLDQAGAALRGDPRTRDLGDAVKACESRVDQSEQQLIATLFAMDLPLAEKLHYRDLVLLTAAIGDLAEDAANRLTIFALKREA